MLYELEERIRRLEDLQSGFHDNLARFGLEWFNRYYGVYRGFCMRNDDPDERGRIQVSVPDVGHTPGVYPNLWVDPVFAAAGTDRGTMLPPEVGDCVRVFMFSGDSARPVGYLGGWFGESDVPDELAYSENGFPERRGFVSRMGHAVWVSDDAGSEEINIVWHKADPADTALVNRSESADRTTGQSASLKFASDGSIAVTNVASSAVVLKADGTVSITTTKGNSLIVTPDGSITSTDSGGDFTKLDPEGKFLVVAGETDIQAPATGAGSMHLTVDPSSIRLGGLAADQQLVLGTLYGIHMAQLTASLIIIGVALTTVSAAISPLMLPPAVAAAQAGLAVAIAALGTPTTPGTAINATTLLALDLSASSFTK